MAAKDSFHSSKEDEILKTAHIEDRNKKYEKPPLVDYASKENRAQGIASTKEQQIDNVQASSPVSMDSQMSSSYSVKSNTVARERYEKLKKMYERVTRRSALGDDEVSLRGAGSDSDSSFRR